MSTVGPNLLTLGAQHVVPDLPVVVGVGGGGVGGGGGGETRRTVFGVR